MKKKMKINDKEKLKIFSDITRGKYSREATHDSLDAFMTNVGLPEFVNEDSYTISTRQLQILDSLIRLLNNKLDALLIEKVERLKKFNWSHFHKSLDMAMATYLNENHSASLSKTNLNQFMTFSYEKTRGKK